MIVPARLIRRRSKTYLLDTLDFGDVVHEHALDTALERDRAGVATAARALELEPYDSISVLALSESSVLDISTILLDRGSHTRIEQFFNHRNRLAVRVEDERILATLTRGVVRVRKERVTGSEEFHDGTVDLGLER